MLKLNFKFIVATVTRLLCYSQSNMTKSNFIENATILISSLYYKYYFKTEGEIRQLATNILKMCKKTSPI